MLFHDCWREFQGVADIGLFPNQIIDWCKIGHQNRRFNRPGTKTFLLYTEDINGLVSDLYGFGMTDEGGLECEGVGSLLCRFRCCFGGA